MGNKEGKGRRRHVFRLLASMGVLVTSFLMISTYYGVQAKVDVGGELQMKQLTAGKYHTCAIASDNQAYCWGEGTYGRLGSGSDDDQNTPKQILQGAIPSGATILQISAGEEHTCVLASDYKVYCWGGGSDGQLGDGNNTETQATPVAVAQGEMPTEATVRSISSADWHTCAIASDNKAYCWGWGTHGQLGDGNNTETQATPVAVAQGEMPVGATFKEINGADWHTCAIASDNKAYCWGAGGGGRLGYGGTASRNTPTAVVQGEMPTGATIRQISGGDQHTCAVASDNKAYCWGAGTNGSLGNGSMDLETTPVAVVQGAMPAGATVHQLIAGNYHTCALVSDGQIYCWGGGDDGQLGNGDTDHHSVPVQVVQGEAPAGATFQQLNGADWHTCAIASDNQAYCWGYGGPGQLGNGTNPSVQSTPVGVSSIQRPVSISQSVHRVYEPSATSNPGSPLAATNAPAVLSAVASDFRLRIGLTNIEGIQFLSISSGETHTCGIAADYKAYCWGEGLYGQLGNGGNTAQPTPVAVLQGAMPAGAIIREISAGPAHTCAIASDEKAYCWGYGEGGRLGDGNTNNQSAPVAVAQGDMPSGVTVQKISASGYHTCLVASDNKAYCWGNGDIGQLGNGAAGHASTPTAIAQGAMPDLNVQDISVGDGHSCAIASDNKAYCWGNNAGGQLGDGSTTERLSPVAVHQGVMPSGGLIKELGAGANHTCAVASDNKAYCWGRGGNGRLGNGGVGDQSTPVAVLQGAMLAGSTILSIDSGDAHTCVVASNNKAYCWGWGGSGRLGNGLTGNQTAPVAVLQGAMPSGGTTIHRVSSGDAHTCAVADDSKTYCWGYGGNHQLGNGNTANRTTPFLVSQGQVMASGNLTVGVSSIVAGFSYTCVTSTDGKVFCWGKEDAEGRLGNGATSGNQSSPVMVVQGEIPIGVSIQQISAGPNHACALGSNSKVYCWGSGSNGRLGNGATSQESAPVEVAQGAIPAGIGIQQISMGESHSCALATNHKAYCWGRDNYGQLGISASSSDQWEPFEVSPGGVPAGVTFNSIAAGANFTCATASNHKAYCWGLGSDGQLGTGVMSNQNTPTEVAQGAMPAGVSLVQIEGGDWHACGIASDHKAYCWGISEYGQRGDGTTTRNISSPVAIAQGEIPTNVTFQQISASMYHTCAVASNHKVYCWGSGNAGRLGNGNNVLHISPVQVQQGDVPANISMQYVTTGGDHTCAVASNHKAYCWGYGGDGQLGSGTLPGTRTTPLAVVQGMMVDTTLIVDSNRLDLSLQVAPLGTAEACSAVSSGWGAVTATSAMNWGISPPTHTTVINTFGGDPLAPTVAGYAYQSIVQQGSFSNSQPIAPRQTGLWDVVLHDRSSRSATEYCFRIVSDTAGDEITYHHYPRIGTASGLLGLQFVNNSGEPLNEENVSTEFSTALISSEVQTSTGLLTDTETKQLEVHNSSSNSGWSVSLAATGGMGAAWQSGAHSYPYNAGTSSEGQLSVVLVDAEQSGHGTDPTGATCTTADVVIGPGGIFSNTVSAVTLLSGSTSAQFNCRWRLKNIGLLQTIPPSQPAGTYTLELTATIVAN